MNFPACTANIDAKTTDKEKSNVVFNLFLKAYEDALLESVNADAEVDNMRHSNDQVMKAFMADESQAGGFGPPPIHTGHAIAAAQGRADVARENKRQAKVMLTFIRDLLGKPRIKQIRKRYPLGRVKSVKGSIQFTSTLNSGQATVVGNFGSKGPLDAP